MCGSFGSEILVIFDEIRQLEFYIKEVEGLKKQRQNETEGERERLAGQDTYVSDTRYRLKRLGAWPTVFLSGLGIRPPTFSLLPLCPGLP